MLIQEAISYLYNDITSLSWVERFGGVVKTVEKDNKAYPVSCTVNETDCFNNQRYQDLTPDNSKASILYFEVLQGLSDARNFDNSARETRIELFGRVRLVGWLNTDKLGINSCNVAAQAMRSVLPIINKTITPTDVNTLFENSTIKYRFRNELPKEHKNIFGKYAYKDKGGIFLHPYDYFAIDIDVTVVLPLGCNYDLQTGTPIQCTDYTKI
jgi:hypothetical protein